jgi:hypothetical protein
MARHHPQSTDSDEDLGKTTKRTKEHLSSRCKNGRCLCLGGTVTARAIVLLVTLMLKDDGVDAQPRLPSCTT